MKITIEGKEYELDVEKAKNDGLLKPVIVLQTGNVYRSGCITLVLVRVTWPKENRYKEFNSESQWQLLRDRLDTYSDTFFQSTHTPAEVTKYLTDNRYTFVKNIAGEFSTLATG